MERVAVLIAGLLVGLSGLSSCAVLGSQGVGEPEVVRAVECFATSWNRHDMDAFARCFTSDADFVDSTGAWWQGRDSIQKNHAFLFGLTDLAARGVTLPPRAYGAYRDTTFAFTSVAPRVLRGDVRVVLATWRLGHERRAARARIGMMTLVVSREAGVWRIASAHATESDRPGSEPDLRR